MKKKILSVLCAIMIVAGAFGIPAYADGCSEWAPKETTTSCPIDYVCLIAGNPNPYQYVYTTHYTRVCVRADGSTYQQDDYRESRPGGCCRS